jgi:hypothetical protein
MFLRTGFLASCSLVAAVALTACAGHGVFAPSTANGASAAALTKGTQYAVDRATSDRLSPDGTRLFSPNATGVVLRTSVSLRSDDRFVTQRMYSTPFGPLTVTERKETAEEAAVRIAAARPPMNRVASAPKEVSPLIESGTTPAGGSYVIVAISDADWLVQLKYGGTVLSTTVPASTPISVVRAFVDSVS